MLKLLWAECQKLRRPSIALLTIFAAVLAAIVVFIGGNSMDLEGQYIDSAGWYMTMVQPWSTLLVIPAVIALLGSYMVCREEQDGTMKTLRLIPVNEIKLTIAKLIVTFIFSIFVYVPLFIIAFLAEAYLHFSDLSAEMDLDFLKTYFLEGIGVFLAVSPIIAFITYTKKSYCLALILTEMYSFAGLFMSMSGTLRTFYPITAVMGVADYYETTTEKLIASITILLLCGCLSILLLIGLNHKKGKIYDEKIISHRYLGNAVLGSMKIRILSQMALLHGQYH